MLGVGVELPLWGRGGAHSEATADRLRAEREREAVADDVLLEVETARRRLEREGHVIALYRDRILPTARNRLAAVRAAYETGRLGFMEVVEAERGLRDDELAYETAVAAAYRYTTALHRATGRLTAREEGERP
jgi:cobalt-zinc-cadmium efflux system outer membrane protein